METNRKMPSLLLMAASLILCLGSLVGSAAGMNLGSTQMSVSQDLFRIKLDKKHTLTEAD